jgi:hypothetical protein
MKSEKLSIRNAGLKYFWISFDCQDDFEAPGEAPVPASLGAGHPCYPGFTGSPLEWTQVRGRSGQHCWPAGSSPLWRPETMFESLHSLHPRFKFHVLLFIVQFLSTPHPRIGLVFDCILDPNDLRRFLRPSSLSLADFLDHLRPSYSNLPPTTFFLTTPLFHQTTPPPLPGASAP